MLNIKKYVLILAVFIIVAVGAFFISSGFKKRTDVYLINFSVSGDGSVITIETTLSGSMGYIRDMKTERINDAVYCSFYSAFGGLNSSIGAKSRFEIKLDDSSAKIYFDRGKGPADLVLEKNTATNVWIQR